MSDALTFCGDTVDADAFADADVIVAVNHVTGAETIYYGRSLFEEVIAHGDDDTQILRIPIDFATDEPEWLMGACVVLKGHCDAPSVD